MCDVERDDWKNSIRGVIFQSLLLNSTNRDFMGTIEGKRYIHQVTVEFEDVDSYKIVHHTRLIAYLERARVHFLASLGIDLFPSGLNIVLYSLEMRFKRPALFGDLLQVAVFIQSVDDYRMVLGYKITRGADLIARAATGIAFMDSVSGVIVPAPESYMEKISPFMLNSTTEEVVTDE
jgi:acyl-CoA thioester hydrolase